ncbi:MAG: hypothetical protein KDA33_09160, partial [Phycisphaerales bacterium]|nr:hypothetical protein [Phycisphaerales bacterium]
MTPDSEKQPELSFGDLQPHMIDLGRGDQRVAPPKENPPAGGGDPPKTLGAPERSWNRLELYGCFFILMVAIQVALGPKIQLSQWEMNADSNAAVAEAVAWHKGRLDIPPTRKGELLWMYPKVDEEDLKDPAVRLHDTAYNPDDHKYYNVFPPLFSFLTIAVWPFHDYVGMPETMWRPEMMTLVIFWPLCITTYVVFLRRVKHPVWAAVLAFAFIGGTAVLPNLNETRHGYLGQMDHVMSQIGLLILAADLLGRQRIWPALIGLMIAVYARQITFLYGLAILWVGWKRFGAKGFILSGLGLAAVAAPLLTLNMMKFGHPLDFGYKYIYAGREDSYMGARCQNYGTFS